MNKISEALSKFKAAHTDIVVSYEPLYDVTYFTPLLEKGKTISTDLSSVEREWNNKDYWAWDTPNFLPTCGKQATDKRSQGVGTIGFVVLQTNHKTNKKLTTGTKVFCLKVE